jgi:hypothetical protein
MVSFLSGHKNTSDVIMDETAKCMYMHVRILFMWRYHKYNTFPWPSFLSLLWHKFGCHLLHSHGRGKQWWKKKHKEGSSYYKVILCLSCPLKRPLNISFSAEYWILYYLSHSIYTVNNRILVKYSKGSWGSSANVEIRLWAGRPGFNSWQGPLSLRHRIQDQLWGPPSLLSNGY